MNPLKAAMEVAQWLESQGIRYFFIGGIALQYWGETRLTRDVDVTILVEPEQVDAFLQEAFKRFRPRIPNALEFAKQHRVLLVETEDGVPVDISLGTFGYEEEAWKHSKEAEFAGFGRLRLISAEDLIIHKCVAGRPRDAEDVESILVRQKLQVDFERIRFWLSTFREIVDTHDPLIVFETAHQNAQRAMKGGERHG
ncbi:MAG: nucleotidyltransferase [Armatimonadetes bacterium]|nr:nucleotidyltransferase [Armatimonadota bacterium]MDW8029558.1 nucleotidyltransferase [Armatimonadota bacterium]